MRGMDGGSTNLFCGVKPGLEMALLASTTAYGAELPHATERAISGVAPRLWENASKVMVDAQRHSGARGRTLTAQTGGCGFCCRSRAGARAICFAGPRRLAAVG